MFTNDIHWHKATLSLAADAIIQRFCKPQEPKKKEKYRRYAERPCSKKRHKTANGARRHIRLLVESGHALKNEMNFYRCKDCQWLHVGRHDEFHLKEQLKIKQRNRIRASNRYSD